MDGFKKLMSMFKSLKIILVGIYRHRIVAWKTLKMTSLSSTNGYKNQQTKLNS